MKRYASLSEKEDAETRLGFREKAEKILRVHEVAEKLDYGTQILRQI